MLPLNQICAGTLRALSGMMADLAASADMASFSAASSTGMASFGAASGAGASRGGIDGGSNPLAMALQPPQAQHVPLGSGSGAWDVKGMGLMAKQPPAGIRTSTGGIGGGQGQDQGPVLVELSQPSALSTPPTARPVSPDVFDAAAAANGPV